MSNPNVPRRLSRQRASDSGDSQLINVQAGGNTCPAELPDDPSSQRTRLWRCGHARSSFSMQSMPNNMQAGDDTCPAGPLDIAESLLNSPRRCGRLRIPDSFFSSFSLNSPVVVDGCVFLNPSSLFSSQKNLNAPFGGSFNLLSPAPVAENFARRAVPDVLS